MTLSHLEFHHSSQVKGALETHIAAEPALFEEAETMPYRNLKEWTALCLLLLHSALPAPVAACTTSLNLAAITSPSLSFDNYASLIAQEGARRAAKLRERLDQVKLPFHSRENTIQFHWDNKPDCLTGKRFPPGTMWHLPDYYQGNTQSYVFRFFATRGSQVIGYFEPGGFSVHWNDFYSDQFYSDRQLAKQQNDRAFKRLYKILPGYYFPQTAHGRARMDLFEAGTNFRYELIERSLLQQIRDEKITLDSNATRGLPDLRFALWGHHWIEISPSDLPKGQNFFDTFASVLNALYEEL